MECRTREHDRRIERTNAKSKGDWRSDAYARLFREKRRACESLSAVSYDAECARLSISHRSAPLGIRPPRPRGAVRKQPSRGAGNRIRDGTLSARRRDIAAGCEFHRD